MNQEKTEKRKQVRDLEVTVIYYHAVIFTIPTIKCLNLSFSMNLNMTTV